jgi:hypothetical protein
MASPLNTPAYEVPNWLEYGNGTGSTGPEGSGKVGMYANQGKYTLYDNRTGKVLAEGSSPEELKNIYDVINNTLVPQGNDADWRLYSSNPVIQTQPHRDFRDGGEGPLKLDGNPFGDVIQGYADKSTPGDPRGMVIAGDMPNSFVKDMLLPMVTPIAGAALGYFGGNALLGAMGKGAAPGLGALSNITPSSALATLQAAPIASVPGATLGGAVGGATALGAAAAPAGIVVSHAPLAALTGGLTTSQAAALSTLAGMPAGLGGGAGAGTSASSVPTTTGNEIVVNAKPPLTVPMTVPPIPPFTVPGLGTPSVPPSTPAGPETTGNENIEVRGKPVTPPTVTVPMVPPPIKVPPVPDLGTPKVPSPKSTLDKIIDYTRLGSLAVGTLGNLFGGGSGGGGQYLGTGKLDPIFSAKLPEASLPGGVSSMAARVMPEQNWYEYGFHPEQSFFNTSAPGYTPQPGKTPGMAHGGDFAVRGPGTGRSDSIDAKLSDGEYVIDAETVALLGDGSSKAGAQKLDQFRVNLRKQKGRNLARGKFSVKAKAPEAYLAGGRT